MQKPTIKTYYAPNCWIVISGGSEGWGDITYDNMAVNVSLLAYSGNYAAEWCPTSPSVLTIFKCAEEGFGRPHYSFKSGIEWPVRDFTYTAPEDEGLIGMWIRCEYASIFRVLLSYAAARDKENE